MTKNKLGVYIHIPFCEKKCNYCDFNSWVSGESEIDNYISLLIKEIQNSNTDGYIVDSIFLGGGTPSVLSEENIFYLTDAIYKKVEIDNDLEFTIEANPNSLTLDKIKAYEKVGINRISLGAQSLDERVLKSIGRIHNKEDILKAVELIKSSKIKNFNIDFILGVPDETKDVILKNLEFIKSHEIPHVSYYSLILEENTKMYLDYINGIDLNIPDENIERERYYFIKKSLEGMGYNHYEISNFSKVGYRCRHNLKYWNLDPYIGYGVSAAGFLENKRYKNYDNLKEYKKCVLENLAPREDLEIIPDYELLNERIFMGLRLLDGIDINKLNTDFNIDFLDEYKNEINKNIKNGYIIIEDNKLKLTDLGLSYSNLVELDFFRL